LSGLPYLTGDARGPLVNVVVHQCRRGGLPDGVYLISGQIQD
jgi:hypothetical protein